MGDKEHHAAWRQRARFRVDQHKCRIGCQRCGYDKCGAALDWHHPNHDKDLILTCRNYFSPKGEAERAKCVLLCANCHRETHYAVEELP